MKRELKDRWVAALRSGDYQQTESHLRDAFGYCCLGVLCDLDGAEWTARNRVSDDYPVFGTSPQLDEVLWPNPDRLQRLGLDESLADKAGQMNDNGKSFAEIADWIETNVPVTD